MQKLSMLIFCTTIFVVSCSLFKKKPEVINFKVAPPAGIIDKVNKEEGYVFIRRYGAFRVKEGYLLESRSPDGRIANLTLSGEKLGERIAADIQSGDVEVGDSVYIRRIQSQKPAENPEETPLKPLNDSENQ